MFAFASLAWRAGSTSIASGYIDPIGAIAAQDEALYSHSAIQMATRGDWLTPRFLGRYGLYKPPMIYWLSGMAVKVLGIHAFSFRLPSLLAGAMLAVVVFLYVSSIPLPYTGAGACAAVVLLASDHLWHTLGRLNLTDMPLALAITVAVLSTASDPRLETRRSFWSFSLATGAAILTKAIAGLLPILIVAVWWFMLRTAPRGRRILQVIAVIIAVAAPWHVYQLVAHQRWFWAEYVLTEHLAFGFGSPPQTSQENQAWFYLRRMFAIDPVLICSAVIAIPLWRKSPEWKLLFAWILVGGAALLTFQYRNVSYVLPMIPALAILGSRAFSNRKIAMAVLPAIIAVKLLCPAQPWGIDYPAGSTIASAATLRDYCERHRGNELMIVQPDDEFYAAVLPLAHVRYCYVTRGEAWRAYALDFRELGIVVSASEFLHLADWRPTYSLRMKDWGLDTNEPLATVVLADSTQQVAQIVEAHPDNDFLVPAGMFQDRSWLSHDTFRADAEHTLLLSRTKEPAADLPWSCRQ